MIKLTEIKYGIKDRTTGQVVCLAADKNLLQDFIDNTKRFEDVVVIEIKKEGGYYRGERNIIFR